MDTRQSKRFPYLRMQLWWRSVAEDSQIRGSWIRGSQRDFRIFACSCGGDLSQRTARSEVHGYEAVKEISVSSHAAVVAICRRGQPDQRFMDTRQSKRFPYLRMQLWWRSVAEDS